MRPLAIVCGLLLAACSTFPARSPDDAPQARVTYRDLDLRDARHRLVLVERVDRAAADYCRDHSAIVTPWPRRNDPDWCPATMRVQLMWVMPREVRRAYDAGWARRPTGR